MKAAAKTLKSSNGTKRKIVCTVCWAVTDIAPYNDIQGTAPWAVSHSLLYQSVHIIEQHFLLCVTHSFTLKWRSGTSGCADVFQTDKSDYWCSLDLWSPPLKYFYSAITFYISGHRLNWCYWHFISGPIISVQQCISQAFKVRKYHT